ncbi:hypothetical protein G7046_g5825 [Stylonectria norvegica]|nr:hypothetical protein G7046_g5825 [Stylonectria norvegica]
MPVVAQGKRSRAWNIEIFRGSLISSNEQLPSTLRANEKPRIGPPGPCGVTRSGPLVMSPVEVSYRQLNITNFAHRQRLTFALNRISSLLCVASEASHSPRFLLTPPAAAFLFESAGTSLSQTFLAHARVARRTSGFGERGPCRSLISTSISLALTPPRRPLRPSTRTSSILLERCTPPAIK